MTLSKKELGLLVKEARKIKSEKSGKRYTQRLLADDIGRSQSYIGDIESGRTYPSFIILNSIASVCGVPISFFQDRNKLDEDIDNFIKLQLNNLNDKEIVDIREAIKNEPDVKMNYIHDYIKVHSSSINNLFETPESLIKFVLNHPTIIKFCGVDIGTLDRNELDSFIYDLLSHLKLLSYKYKK